MLKIEILECCAVEGPQCLDCGANTLLFGAEDHAVIRTVTVVTYVCKVCKGTRVEMAFSSTMRDQSPNRSSSADKLPVGRVSRCFKSFPTPRLTPASRTRKH